MVGGLISDKVVYRRYVCQLSVHPPTLLWRRLRLVRPLVHVLDGQGEPVASLHYDEGSTIRMTCRVRRAPLYHTSVRWQARTRASL